MTFAGMLERSAAFLDAYALWNQTMVVHAIYENGVFRPTEPVELPENSRVELLIQRQPPADSRAPTTAPLAGLAAIAAAHPENPDLPVDLAAQHDHYLYGTARR